MIPVCVWQIWARCTLVPNWWKSFDATLIPTSHTPTAVVKSTSHLHLMTFCVHFKCSDHWESWTNLNNEWQRKRECLLLEYQRRWRSKQYDTGLEFPGKKANQTRKLTNNYEVALMRLKSQEKFLKRKGREVKEAFNKIFQDYERKDKIRQVPKSGVVE